MHLNRLKHLLVALLAVFALGAVAAASASAAPTWRKAGAALSGKAKFTVNSDTSRLWSPPLGIVILCKKDHGTGEIENVSSAGVDTAEVLYEECSAWSTTENAAKQIIQKEKLGVCTVKEPITAKTKSKLAYVVGHETVAPIEVVDVFEPTEAGGTFTEIILTGTSCVPKGTYKVTGSVIGKIPRVQTAAAPTEEAVMGDVLFETNNEPAAKTVEQRYKKYELGGVVTEDTLKLGSNAAALESTDQVELAPNAAAPFGPEPFGVHS